MDLRNSEASQRCRGPWPPALTGIVLLVLFNLACEGVERLLLSRSSLGATAVDLHLHAVGSSLLIAAFVGWQILRRKGSPFQATDRSLALTKAVPDETEDLRNYGLWFVNLRWVAILVCANLVVICTRVTTILPRASFAPLIFFLVAMTVFNIALRWATPRTDRPYGLLMWQAFLDLLILTMLLHYSGDLENPLFALYLLHVLIASILLDRRDAQLILVVSGVMVLALAATQIAAPACHIHLDDLSPEVVHRPTVVLSVAVTFLVILTATSYILSMVKEHLVRTAEDRQAAYEQLLRQERMVVLGEVAAGVAHEINNPLHGVRSALAMIKEEPGDTARSDEFLPLMEDGLDRIALITRRLLLHSRQEPMPVRETDLNETIQESLAFIEFRAREQGTRLSLQLDPWIHPIAADPKALSEVFINLLVNALDAVGNGKTIAVASNPSRSRPGQVEVRFEDTGCGIPREDLKRIFHPFFTTKPVGKGSGLGLSISRRIVEDHDGTIEVQSQVGVGTCFVLTFPAFLGAATPARCPAVAQRG